MKVNEDYKGKITWKLGFEDWNWEGKNDLYQILRRKKNLNLPNTEKKEEFESVKIRKIMMKHVEIEKNWKYGMKLKKLKKDKEKGELWKIWKKCSIWAALPLKRQ